MEDSSRFKAIERKLDFLSEDVKKIIRLLASTNKLLDDTALQTLSKEFTFGNQLSSGGQTKGVVVVFPDDEFVPDNYPVQRTNIICLSDISNEIPYSHICLLAEVFQKDITNMQLVRILVSKNTYSILIAFTNQKSADDFYEYSKDSKSQWRCLFTQSVEYTQKPSARTEQQALCGSCQEKLVPKSTPVLITMCNHAFHSHCVKKWIDTFCPVCCYSHQPTRCVVCNAENALLMCLICRTVFCSRHSEEHYGDTNHSYSLKFETQGVWDFTQNLYVDDILKVKRDPTALDTFLAKYTAEVKADMCARKSSNMDKYKHRIDEAVKNDTRLKELQEKIDFNEKETEKINAEIERMYQCKQQKIDIDKYPSILRGG